MSKCESQWEPRPWMLIPSRRGDIRAGPAGGTWASPLALLVKEACGGALPAVGGAGQSLWVLVPRPPLSKLRHDQEGESGRVSGCRNEAPVSTLWPFLLPLHTAPAGGLLRRERSLEATPRGEARLPAPVSTDLHVHLEELKRWARTAHGSCAFFPLCSQGRLPAMCWGPDTAVGPAENRPARTWPRWSPPSPGHVPSGPGQRLGQQELRALWFRGALEGAGA